MLRSWTLLLMTLVLAMAGCSVHPPVALYQLDGGQPQVPTATDGALVLLGPLTLADYLQRGELLQRQADGSLSVATEAQWAGSLNADVEQLLLRQLAGRLQTPNILLAPAGPGVSADLQVQVSISRLDSGPQMPAVLHAQWRLLDKAGQLQGSRLLQLEQTHQGSLASQVQAQSRLLQQLAEQLATAAVTALKVPAVANPANKRVAPARKTAPLPPAPPVAPAQGAVEVFRF